MTIQRLVLVCVAVLAVAVCEEKARRYRQDIGGLRPVPGGIAAPYRNDKRQHYVNYEAEATGASSGTFRKYGVPGAGRYFYNYPAYYSGYPYYGYYRGDYPYYY